MRNVASGIAETQSGQHAGEHQTFPRGLAGRMNGFDQSLADDLYCFQAMQVAERVRSLAQRAARWIVRHGVPPV